MNVTFIVAALSAGGAERVVSTMANYWARKRWTITILTLDDGSQPPFFELDKSIRHIPLGVSSRSTNLALGVWNNAKRIHALRRAIRRSKPSAIISFVDKTNVIALLAALGTGCHTIVSERTDARAYSIGPLWSFLRRVTYSCASLIVVQSQGAREYFSDTYPNKTTVIPNPVLVPSNLQLRNKPKCFSKYVVLALGRLSEEKGFADLIKAFAMVKDRHRDWEIVIVGEGPERRKLEILRDSHGLSGRVFFAGLTRTPEEYLRQAALFVMPSHLEGFPNALCEAMAYGVPVIATNCSTSVQEIIRAEENGLLIRPANIHELAGAMDRLMSDSVLRSRLGSSATEAVKRFNVDAVMDMWEAVLAPIS